MLILLNTLKTADIIFFIVCGVIVLLCVGAYFLIPFLKRKQLQEQRENLTKREAAFKEATKQARKGVDNIK